MRASRSAREGSFPNVLIFFGQSTLETAEISFSPCVILRAYNNSLRYSSCCTPRNSLSWLTNRLESPSDSAIVARSTLSRRVRALSGVHRLSGDNFVRISKASLFRILFRFSMVRICSMKASCSWGGCFFCRGGIVRSACLATCRASTGQRCGCTRLCRRTD